MYTRLIILIVAMGFISCGGSKEVVKEKPKSSINTDYAVHFMEADKLSIILDEAAEQNKIVYVDIGASWCLPCQLMKEEVYTHQATGKYMNDNFVSYMVDADESNGKDLRAIFGAESLPTLLFLDHKGRVLQRKSGAAFHAELRQLGDQALAIYKDNQANQLEGHSEE